MFSISSGDLLKLLEQLPVWKQMVGMSKEIEALRKRVELLEQSQQQIPKADQCPKCNGLAFKLDRTIPHPTFGMMGKQLRVYVCGTCGHTENRRVD
ncbi:hypothetical protein [Burkholderia glumae]|uniref:hypothetical protein n=1 Tax=Burkholderia glumae TaxID=337 RepID=UPI002151540E|nr:hypothetical protein [Burkholderia glumae]